MITQEQFGPIQRIQCPDFPLHPLCTAWPEASEYDLNKMIQITQKLGGIFNDPATIWRGEIVDGRNRQIVAQKTGVEFEYREFFGDYPALRAFVVAKNLGRRHLQPSQRAMLVAKLADVDEMNGYGSGRKRDQIAESAQVGKNLADRALRLKKEADQSVIDRVLNGESSINKEIKELDRKSRTLERPKAEVLGSNIKRSKRIDESEDMFVDAMGVTVPSSLHEVWKVMGMWTTLKDKTEEMHIEMKRLIGLAAGHGLSTSHLENLKDQMGELENKRPHYVCPHCSGGRKCSCEKCRKKWLSRGKEDCDICYCCDGHGFLLKDEPYPEEEWRKNGV